MQLADESDAKRKFGKPCHSMLQRNDVVSDFAQIFRTAINNCPRFGSQQFAQGGLRAFDAARQNSLAAYEGANENVRVG